MPTQEGLNINTPYSRRYAFRSWIGRLTRTNLNIWTLFTPEVGLPLILRMRSGSNHVNRQSYKAKTPKSNNNNISETINLIKLRFEDHVGSLHGTHGLHFVGSLILPTQNPTWLRPPFEDRYYDKWVKIETGSRIPVWWPLVFRKRKYNNISAVD